MECSKADEVLNDNTKVSDVRSLLGTVLLKLDNILDLARRDPNNDALWFHESYQFSKEVALVIVDHRSRNDLLRKRAPGEVTAANKS